MLVPVYTKLLSAGDAPLLKILSREGNIEYATLDFR